MSDMYETTEITVHRVVDFDVAGGDGRTLHTRVVPWDVPATVGDPPYFTPYQESWARGSFDKQLRAANRIDVLMNFEHQQGIGGIVGRGIELRDEADGLHGTFRMLGTQDADKALELVREQILTGLSLEARVLRSETIDGIVVRQDGRLMNVALCRAKDSPYAGPKAAFAGAEVLAVRQETATDDEPDPKPDDGEPAKVRERIELPPPIDFERLDRLGIKLPEQVRERLDSNP